ncbi:MAG: 4-hydroxy-tetrahydrodipicolinate reductase [Eubacteriales bacterium]|jgi:4-hydroxy-tetrahydrodipicolinate reductase|nr:4-hydroxy-tetrahydrodipicolinate reductase [Eubacteriales bacterium]
MIKVMLSGCNGKMGQVITSIVEKSEGMEIVCGVDINTVSKNDYPVVSSPFDFSGSVDVIIDFSHPSSLENVLGYATEKSIPVVIATTGLSSEQVKKINNAAAKVPVFFSANMSLGVNLVIDLVTRAVKLLEESFDIEIIEKHHNQKIDAPSGTALAIADAISDVLSEPSEYVYDRHSVRRKRKKREIGIHAVRGGTIVGEHSVIFAGQDEIIEIKHSAASREVFAVGAVRAGKFIIGKEPNLYNMKDLVSSL